MRFPFTFLALVFALGAACVACRSSSPAQPGVDDAGDAAADAGAGADATLNEDSGDQCSPCYQTCACAPGDQWPAPQACVTYVCGGNGMWGPFECLGHGCPDAGSEASADASPDAPADAPTDAPADASADVDGGPEDAPGDVTSDGATDG